MHVVQSNRANSGTLFIGLYRSYSAVNTLNWTFDTYVGMKDSFVQKPIINVFKPTLVEMMSVPVQWQESMRNHADSNSSQIAGLVHLGRIGVTIREKRDRTILYTASYFPRSTFNRTEAPGLGYATEAMIILHMRPSITHVSTTIDASAARRRQLERANLPYYTPTPVDEWLEGLRRGLQLSLRRNEETMQ